MVGRMTCLTLVVVLAAAAVPGQGAAAVSPPPAAVAQAVAALDVVAADLAEVRAQVDGVRAFSDRPPLAAVRTLGLVPVRLDAAVAPLSGLHWTVADPLLDRAAALRREARELEEGVRCWEPPARPDRPAASAPRGTGAVGGTITDATTGGPLPGIPITAYCEQNYQGAFRYSISASDGTYLVGGIGTETCWVYTDVESGWVNAAWQGWACPGGGCSYNSTGDPVAVTDGAATSGIDLALSRTGAVSGAVTAAGTGQPLGGAQVTLNNASGYGHRVAYTDAAGRWSKGELEPGVYFAVAVHENAISQLWQGIAWPWTTATAGTPIRVGPGGQVPGVDFALQVEGSVAGRVSDAATGAPLAGIIVYAFVGQSVRSSASTGADGTYTIAGLDAGSYHVATWGSSQWVDEVYDDVVCDGWCDPTTGTPVAVQLGATTPGIDLALTRLGTLGGHVSASGSGYPLAGVELRYYDSNGSFGWYSVTDDAGDWTLGTLSRTAPLFIVARGGDYLDELWDDFPCEAGCDPTTGSPVVVVPGIDLAADFVLDLGGWLSGTVRDASTGQPLGAQVTVFDGDGDEVGSASTNSQGHYVIRGLADGSYHVMATSARYAGAMYPDVVCPEACSPTGGMSVAVTAGAATPSVDLALTPGGSIAGTVIAEATGLPVQGLSVRVYRSGVEAHRA